MKTSSKKPLRLAVRLLAVLLSFTLMASALSGCFFIDRLIIRDDPPIEVVVDEEQVNLVHEIADELFAFFVTSDFANYQQLIANPTSFDIAVPNVRFGDITYEAANTAYAYYDELWQMLSSIDYSRLDETGQRLYSYMVSFLDSSRALEPYFYYSDPYETSYGVHAMMPLSLMTFSFRTTQDIDNYLLLVADIPRILEQANEITAERTSRGIFSNLFGVESSIDEASVYTAPVSTNLLVTSFEDSLNSGEAPFASLTQTQRELYAKTNRDIVESLVIPAYENTISVLERVSQLTSYTVSMASYSNSRNYFAAQLQDMGFDVSPDEAIEILDDALDQCLSVLMSSGNAYDPDYWNSVVSDNLPADAAGIIKHLNTTVGKYFPSIGERPFVVDAASDDEVLEMISAFYLFAPVDDPSENRVVYYPQNIGSKLDLVTTLAHESFPGHLYQYNYFALTNPHPLELLLSTTAYSEGYAVYSMYYALLLAGFKPADAELIYVDELANRVLNARIDFGINYEAWTVRELGTYLSQFGWESYADFYFRYFASSPLSSIPYGLGPAEFNNLLDSAESWLGSWFEIKEFHEVILQDGAVYMGYLKDRVSDWMYYF